MEPTAEQRSFIDELVENYMEEILSNVLTYNAQTQNTEEKRMDDMRKSVRYQLYMYGATVSHRVFTEMLEKGYKKDTK